MSLPTLPPAVTPDPAGDYARAQAWAMISAKKTDADNISIWAAQFLDNQIVNLETALSDPTVNDKINALMLLLDNLGDFTPGTISYTDTPFSDTLLTSLRARFSADIDGATAAEAAVFARHSSRADAETNRAHTEITTMYSSAGWEAPQGSMVALQAEATNERAKRLTDASADIMATAAKEATQGAIQLVDMLGRLNDNRDMRAFESAKTEVLVGVDGYKSTLEAIRTKAELGIRGADLSINASLHQMSIKVQTLQSLAQGAFQLMASAEGAVHASTSFGFSGNSDTKYDGDISDKIASNERIAAMKGNVAY